VADDGGVPYPEHWEADVLLRDGATAHLRPIRPADAEGLQQFHLGQSPESVYLRFFAPMPQLSESDARHFANVDHKRRVAFVVTLGDDIVGIGRYEQLDDTTAEVAFNVSDAHQGRGLGSILLEHLAAAARENDVHRFHAEVLPQNRKMLTVFREAGYEVRSDYDDGVIALTFDIDPTERSLAVMEAREHRAEALSMRVLLQPGSVAVIGAGRRPGTIGHRLLADLLAGGYTGRVQVVHPKADAVLGVPAVRSIRDVAGGAELAVVAVPAEGVLDVVRECAASGVRGLVVVSAGFAETGPLGLARQRELVRVARANGLRVIGPNSWGLINADPKVRLNVSLVEAMPAHGRFGLFSQSGGLSVAVLDAVRRRGIGLSTFLSAGNRADVSGNDCLQYWEEDRATDVVGLYLESIGNPRKFVRIARRLARAKPVVVVKSGTSNFGTPPGHAVRPSRAPQEAFDAMLRQSGCIRVETPRQMLDVAQLLLSQPLPAGRRVAVVGNSDALGALIADACTSWDLDVVHGPVSVPSQATPQEFRTALRDAFGDPQVDAVVVAFIPPVRTPGEEVARVLVETAAGSDTPVVACLLGMDGVVDHLRALSEHTETVPSYAVPEEAVRALAAVTRYAEWRRRDPGTRVAPPGMDLDAAHALVRDLLAAATGDGTAAGDGAAAGEDPAAEPEAVTLDEATAARLLALAGVELWPTVPVTDAESAVEAARSLGFPVALKTTAPHLRHRVDLGGVRLDIADERELAADVAEMQARLTPLGGGRLVVQRMAPPGVATVVRTVEDPLFGPVVSFGLGGDASELLGDVAHRIPPLTTVDVADLVRSVRAAPRLFGHRGAAPVDVAALEDVIARAASLADVLPEVDELELNPVVVSQSGAHVLGATVRLAPPPGRTDAARRELAGG
jgi:acyl-CoA synthetase (NDP forming)/RimJ/RimL family protein N-acetyltransferase